VKVYVQKIVAGYVLSLVGPFPSQAQAELFIERALIEEVRYQAARDQRKMDWYKNARYEIMEQGTPMQ
jgi:hypothetical protein